MKYKIEIWQYGCVVDTYEDNDIKEILIFYNSEWRNTYEVGLCSYEVYENEVQLSFDELLKLGLE